MPHRLNSDKRNSEPIVYGIWLLCMTLQSAGHPIPMCVAVFARSGVCQREKTATNQWEWQKTLTDGPLSEHFLPRTEEPPQLDQLYG